MKDFALGAGVPCCATERSIERQLFPVLKDGKLMGFSRRKNDALA